MTRASSKKSKRRSVSTKEAVESAEETTLITPGIKKPRTSKRIEPDVEPDVKKSVKKKKRKSDKPATAEEQADLDSEDNVVPESDDSEPHNKSEDIKTVDFGAIADQVCFDVFLVDEWGLFFQFELSQSPLNHILENLKATSLLAKYHLKLRLHNSSLIISLKITLTLMNFNLTKYRIYQLFY